MSRVPKQKKENASQQNGDRRGNRTILGRTIALMVIFGVLAFIPLLVTLYNIQIRDHERYQELALEQQTRDVAVEANRGSIYDCNGNVLAMSGTVYKIIVSPRDLAAVQQSYAERVEKAKGDANKLPKTPEPTNELVASGLAAILGIDQEKIAGRLERTYSAYEVLTSQAEEEVADQVRTFIKENGLSNSIVITPTSKRYYPNNSLACHVVGFVNSMGGAYGIEALYEDELSGETGRVVTARDGAGKEMLSRYENYYDATDGYDVHLTLDRTIQSYCERVLEKGIDTFEVQDGGLAIVMDPNTGRILAWANSPNYDLNNPSVVTDQATLDALEELKETAGADSDEYKEALGNAQMEQWRNGAISDTYEPGSTFKSIVLAAAFEEGLISESDHFYCPGYVKVPGLAKPIYCSRTTGHGDQTLAEAIQVSCNPAFIEIGKRLGADRFYDYMEAFGFLEPTGIDMQGESQIDGVTSGRVWSREFFTSEIGFTSLVTASFGQRFNVTPIQLVTAVSAVVNGGHLMQPYVMESITDADGNVVKSNQPTEVRQVISETTSEKCREILETVVNGGNGKNAYVAGYRVGGKTGSSETLEKDHTIVSFIGFAPANDPQVVILVAFDNPKPSAPGSNLTSGQWYISGGTMAALMAGELFADVLDYMGVEKQYTESELSGVDTVVPGVVGYDAAGASDRLKNAGFTVRTVGEGDAVTGQIPVGGAVIPKGSQVVLYLGEEKPTDKVSVPNVVGKSPEAARQTLLDAGLYIRVSGAAGYYTSATVAAGQSIEAGTEVERGTVVDVHFMDNTGSTAGAGF